jgi:hypothetical protein
MPSQFHDLLFLLFRQCYKQQQIPNSWKTSLTILLYKKSDPTTLTNHRPIALANTIYKFFTSTITAQLANYGEKYQILQNSQEGFRQERCTSRQLQTLIAALEDSKLIQQDIYLLYIDFKNAFGSIDHARLLSIMADLGYPQDAINLIGNIYSNSSTIFFGPHFGKTKPVHIQRGTIQGDILSPYLFIIFLEPLLRWLERDNLGYKLKTSQYILNSVAYADDLTIITNDIKHIQPQINKIDKFCQWTGMELGIPKCAITGCPNNKPMTATIFKAYIQSHNITYRNQPIPVLHQNEPYVYLGIQLIPSLKWKAQQAVTMNKLIKQTQLLLQSPATLKQKLKMVDTVIRPGIAYSFYTVPYSMPNITKLDKKIIGLQKSICGLPKSTPNITTKLPHDQYGLNAQSLKTEYLTCIGKQLRNALNDPGKLGTLYKGLTIFAKYGGAQHLPLLNKEACLYSPTSRTLYLLKHNGLAHIQTDSTTFPQMETPLTIIWMQKATTHPTITPNISRKYIHQLLLLNITSLEQITLPNRTTLMNNSEFKKYHNKITPTIKKALKIASHLFCTTNCVETCLPPYNIHPQTYTLRPEIVNRPNQQFLHTPLPETIPQLHEPKLPKPPSRIQKLQDYPITTIIDIKHSKHKDKIGTIKIFTSYKCKWTQPDNHNYAMWLNTNKVFPHNKPNITEHNIILLKQFYLAQQHKHYQNKIDKTFYQLQSKDTRYIQTPSQLPLVQINLNECNPDTVINTTEPTIQIIQDKAHIFTNKGNHLITIPKNRLIWLWNQYTANSNTHQQLDPPCQPFITEVI